MEKNRLYSFLARLGGKEKFLEYLFALNIESQQMIYNLLDKINSDNLEEKDKRNLEDYVIHYLMYH